jgi:Fic family protein
MRRADFKSREAGRVIRVPPTGYDAFVPADPPPHISYDDSLVLLLSRADAALSELSGLGRHLPNPHVLIAPYVRREAVLSSRIEGTQTNLSELLLEEVQPGGSEQDPDDVREVRNYVAALEHGIRRLSKLPLGLRLTRELHERLMAGVRGEHALPGEFRRSQNWIGRPGSTLQTATYVPPPPHEMVQALSAWERFVNQRDRVPDLIQCALIHEHFEAIHPFLDGNGRVGRLLITLFLIERRRLSQPLLYLSAYFEANRPEYYRRLQAIRTDGDWDGWLRYFLAGVVEIAAEAVDRAGRLMRLRERYRQKVQDHPKAVRLLDELFVNPYVTSARARAILKTTAPTARAVLGRLLRAGVIEEVGGGARWRRVYVAAAIHEVIAGPEER